MNKHHRVAIAAAACGLGLAGMGIQPVNAAIINGTISGTVTFAGTAVPGVTIGSPVTGTYSYDDAVTIRYGREGDIIANYLNSFFLSIGTNPQTFNLSSLSYAPVRYLIPFIGGGTVDEVLFSLNYPSLKSFIGGDTPLPANSAFGGLALGPQIITLRNFTDPSRSLVFNYIATSAKPVPEPRSNAFWVVSGGICWLMRKKAAQSMKSKT